MAFSTRRSVLASAAVGAAATAAGVVAASPARATTGSVTSGGTTRISLSGSGLRRIDAPAAARPGAVQHLVARAGERSVVTATVTTSGGGTGTLHSDVVRLHDRGQPPHGGTASTLEQHLFTLPGGTLVGSGTVDLQGHGVFAVIGGTGRYAGCSGSYVAHQQRVDLGGDGSARYEIVLNGWATSAWDTVSDTVPATDSTTDRETTR